MTDFSSAHGAMRKRGVACDPASLAGWRILCAYVLGLPASASPSLPREAGIPFQPMPRDLAWMLRHPITPGYAHPLYR